MSSSAASSFHQQSRVRLINTSSPGLSNNNGTRLQPVRATVPYQLLRGSQQSPSVCSSLCIGSGNGASTLTVNQSQSPPCPDKVENGFVEPKSAAVLSLSPDTQNLLEWHPGSGFCTVEWSKLQAARASTAIRRTSSLDTVTGQYLSGQWPREHHLPHFTCMRDKSTQTPGVWNEDVELNTHKRSASWGSADHLREQIARLRQQLHRGKQGSRQSKDKELGPHSILSQIQSKMLPAAPSNVTQSKALICRVPSYIEGINHELENVFLDDDLEKKEMKAMDVLDGRHPPLPSHYHGNIHTRSTNSQVSSSGGSSPWWCPSPTSQSDSQSSRPCSAEDYDRDSGSSSPLPTFSTSPKPNNSFMFKREPPEGCERVKVFEETVSARSNGFPLFSCPDRNKVNFTPTGSAFCPVKLLCSSLYTSYSVPNPTAIQNSRSPTIVRHSSPPPPPTEFREQDDSLPHPVTCDPCTTQQCLLFS